MEFYERQQQDIERFKALRDKVWQQILDDNEKLAVTFGGKEHLNTDAKKLYDSRINSFNAEWSMEGGSRYNNLTDQHDKQLKQITGNNKSNTPQEKDLPRKEKSENTTKEKFQNQSESMTDKEQQQETNKADEETEREQIRAKIARQQAAIKARQMQKKRGR